MLYSLSGSTGYIKVISEVVKYFSLMKDFSDEHWVGHIKIFLIHN